LCSKKEGRQRRPDRPTRSRVSPAPHLRVGGEGAGGAAGGGAGAVASAPSARTGRTKVMIQKGSNESLNAECCMRLEPLD
jgi:hypothetical protein